MPTTLRRGARALLICCAAIPAAAAIAQSPTARAALQQFERSTGGVWQARWQLATDTPRVLFGTGAPLADFRENSLAEARRHAQQIVRQHQDLLHTEAVALRETIGARLGRSYTFTFDAAWHGLPMVGAQVDVRIHGNGRLVGLGSTVARLPDGFSDQPQIAPEVAVAIAWQRLGQTPTPLPQPGAQRTVRLCVWVDQDAAAAAVPRLAFEVPIAALDADGRGPFGRAYVDAQSGAWLAFANDKHECGTGCSHAPTAHRAEDHGEPRPALPVPTPVTVLAWTHSGFSPVSAPTNEPLAGAKLVVPGVGTVTTDAQGQCSVDLSAPTTVTVRLDGVRCGLVTGPNAPTATVTLQPGQPATIQLASASAGEQPLAHTTTYHWTHRVNEWARSILGNTPQLAVADQVLPTVNIASACNAFYAGNTINFYASGGGCNNTAAASVVAHEWGHGLDDRYGGISQTNGLSEGWGDICSMYLLDDPTIGHDFFSGGGGIRTGTNGRQYPTGNGVHAQGESWMGFAWKLRQNLRASLGSALAIATSNDIVLGSIAANAGNQADAVLQVFLADDDDGNLANGTPHHSELAAACQAHSLPYPQVQVGYLQHTPLATTTAQLRPREVAMLAVPVSGNFQQVRVHWADGQQRQRDLIPGPVANQWTGLLPGQLAPQSVQYHFEALHSSNTWLRLPPAGEFQYGTLAEKRLFFDDFEGAATGWSHGAITGIDDWEIGTPLGRTGFGWADPAAAASGSRCAGTDLSGNGAYPPSTESWLRSPPVDCSTANTVRLRCQVWLSCEGPVDQLEVRCQGIPIWLSPQTPRRDNTWQPLELTAPMAVGQPAAQFEFRLRSNALIEFGGFQIDDVEVYTQNQAVALPAELRILPEQASQGTPMQIAVQTQGQQPFLLAIGDQPGPLPLAGLPALQAGGNLLTLFTLTDLAGSYTWAFQAPGGVPQSGYRWYSHVLTLNPAGAVVGSNAFVNLFTR
ncbi:MAG: hypothetical protein JNK49_16375 [Planctomycetes bacterium]|nr:hypothetical protein [Planctomycetota bacterium]